MSIILAIISMSISIPLIIITYDRNLEDGDKLADRANRWFEAASMKKKIGLVVLFVGLPAIIIFPVVSASIDTVFDGLAQTVTEQDEETELDEEIDPDELSGSELLHYKIDKKLKEAMDKAENK